MTPETKPTRQELIEGAREQSRILRNTRYSPEAAALLDQLADALEETERQIGALCPIHRQRLGVSTVCPMCAWFEANTRVALIACEQERDRQYGENAGLIAEHDALIEKAEAFDAVADLLENGWAQMEGSASGVLIVELTACQRGERITKAKTLLQAIQAIEGNRQAMASEKSGEGKA